MAISKEELKLFRESQPNYLMDLIKAFPDTFDYKNSSKGKIKKHQARYDVWNYSFLSYNPNITWEFIQANLDKPWSFRWLSYNPAITCDIIKSHPELPWSYLYISDNPNVTANMVLNNLDRDWNYISLWLNKKIWREIEEEIKGKIDSYWDFLWEDEKRELLWEGKFTKEEKDDEDDVFTFEELGDNVDFYTAQCNMIITPEMIRKNPNKNWQLRAISANPFLYNEELCMYEYKKSTEKRKKDVMPVLDFIFYKELSSVVLDYVSYD
jgi:hypothetical protein